MSSTAPTHPANDENPVPTTRSGWLFIVVFVTLVFGWTVTFPWQWDDFGLIARAPTDRTLADLWTSDFWRHTSSPHTSGLYRPVLSTSYWFESVLLGGPHPYLSRAINVGLLSLAGFLVVKCLQRWRLPGHPVVALVAIAHPVVCQSVGYVSGRSDVMMICWVLLAACAAGSLAHTADGGAPDRRAQITVTICLAMAVWTKESAVVVGMLIPLLAMQHAHARRRFRGWCAPWIVGLSIALLARAAALGGEAPTPRTFGGIEVVVRYVWYLQALLIPVPRPPIVASAALPLTTGTAVIAIVGILLTTLYRRSPRHAAVVTLWLVISLAPVAEWVTFNVRVSESLALSAWMGLCMLLASPLVGLFRVAPKSVVLALALYTGVTIVSLRPWSNGVWLWSLAVEDEPGVPANQRMLIAELIRAGRVPEADEVFSAVHAANRNNAGDLREIGDAAFNLGNAWKRQGEFELAIRRYLDAFEIHGSSFCPAAANAALLLRERSALPRARAVLARVPANDTHGDRCYVFMANFYGALGDIERARTWVELGQRVYPDNRQLRELQSALAASGVHPPRP